MAVVQRNAKRAWKRARCARVGVDCARLSDAAGETDTGSGTELRRPSCESVADVGSGKWIFSGLGCAEANIPFCVRGRLWRHVRTWGDLGFCRTQEPRATISGPRLDGRVATAGRAANDVPERTGGIAPVFPAGSRPEDIAWRCGSWRATYASDEGQRRKVRVCVLSGPRHGSASGFSIDGDAKTAGLVV